MLDWGLDGQMQTAVYGKGQAAVLLTVKESLGPQKKNNGLKGSC